jgi:hypothetical protein
VRLLTPGAAKYRALNLLAKTADQPSMGASEYAFVHGIRSTRAILTDWNARPFPLLGAWFLGSLAAAAALLLAVWGIALVLGGGGPVSLHRPPLQVGGLTDVTRILSRNLLVLALHAMACVAGFMAGSSLPLQAAQRTGISRWLHERAGRLAIVFVVGATAGSLSAQAFVLGGSVARVAFALHTSPGLLLVALLPHALPELTALFLPLAAWIIASRTGDWDKLLAATLVTLALALPILVTAAVWEVYVAPHVLAAVV